MIARYPPKGKNIPRAYFAYFLSLSLCLSGCVFKIHMGLWVETRYRSFTLIRKKQYKRDGKKRSCKGKRVCVQMNFQEYTYGQSERRLPEHK